MKAQFSVGVAKVGALILKCQVFLKLFFEISKKS